MFAKSFLVVCLLTVGYLSVTNGNDYCSCYCCTGPTCQPVYRGTLEVLSCERLSCYNACMMTFRNLCDGPQSNVRIVCKEIDTTTIAPPINTTLTTTLPPTTSTITTTVETSTTSVLTSTTSSYSTPNGTMTSTTGTITSNATTITESSTTSPQTSLSSSSTLPTSTVTQTTSAQTTTVTQSTKPITTTTMAPHSDGTILYTRPLLTTLVSILAYTMIKVLL